MARLVTLPPSHFCEKARWALDRAQIEYVEERHVPTFHYPFTRRLGGGSTPILVHDDGVLFDSTDILRWVDTRLPEDRRLFWGTEAAALEDAWDQRLGPDIRVYAYSWLLDCPMPFQRLLGEGTPPWERRLFSVVHPVVAGLVRRGLRVTPERGARAFDRIQQAFDSADRLLADGRPYLCGDRFSAADLTFASLTMPLLRPEGSPAPMIRTDEMPDGLREALAPLLARPSARHVARLYRENRN